MGVALVLFVVVAGQWIADSPSWSRVFTLSGIALAFAIIAYGFAASALPVWLLLAPRDYLSAFIKAGAIFSLAAGILFVRPQVLMPPLTRFIDGAGPSLPERFFLSVSSPLLARDQRISLADFLRHHAEDDPSRKSCSLHRLRRDAA